MSGSTEPAGKRLGLCLATKRFFPIYVGPALRFLRYSPGLRDRGIDLEVFTQEVTADRARRDGLLDEPPNEVADATGAAPLPELEDVKVSRASVGQGRGSSRTYYHKLADHCAQAKHRLAIAQFLNVDVWSIPCTRRLRRMGIGSVFTYTLLSELSKNALKRRAQRLHRRLQIDHVDHIVVSSSVMKEELEALGVSSAVSVIPNGVDLERFRPPADAEERSRLRSDLGLGVDWKILLTVGPVSPRKGADSLIRAFGRMAAQEPKAHLVVVGPRHDLARPELRSFHNEICDAIRAAGVGSRVVFVGPRTNVVDYMQAADVFAFASRREGMPNVVPEAMACRLPVVTTPFQGLPAEFGVPGKEYVLSSWDEERLAADLAEVCGSQNRMDSLGRASRTWAERHLDLSQSIEQYALLYREIARTMESAH